MTVESCPDCGRPLRQGARYGEALRTVQVCLDARTGEGCGYETPTLYERTKSYRNGHYEYTPVGADWEAVTDGR